MKSTMLITIAALLAGCAPGLHVAKSDAETAYMRGHIRQVRETLYDNPADPATLPDTLGADDIVTVLDYNRAGNITLMETFVGPDRVQTAKEEYFYDPSGERIERAVSHDPARRGTTTVLYGYDAQGRLTSEVESNGFYRFDQSYNSRGYLKTRSTNSPETGENVVIARYVYDCKGRLKRLKGERKEKYRYHPNGTIAEVRGAQNSIDFYDEHGNLVTMAVIVKRRNSKGRVFERFSVTLTAEYEYDARGNWMRRVLLYKGEVQSVAVREIGYYGEKDE